VLQLPTTTNFLRCIFFCLITGQIYQEHYTKKINNFTNTVIEK